MFVWSLDFYYLWILCAIFNRSSYYDGCLCCPYTFTWGKITRHTMKLSIAWCLHVQCTYCMSYWSVPSPFLRFSVLCCTIFTYFRSFTLLASMRFQNVVAFKLHLVFTVTVTTYGTSAISVSPSKSCLPLSKPVQYYYFFRYISIFGPRGLQFTPVMALGHNNNYNSLYCFVRVKNLELSS